MTAIAQYRCSRKSVAFRLPPLQIHEAGRHSLNIATEPLHGLACFCFFFVSFLLINLSRPRKSYSVFCAFILLQVHFRSRTLCLVVMRLHILIPAFLAGAVLTAAGPLITDAILVAQTQAEITTCHQCANNLCGLCPPSLFCTACFDKNNCYACPYMSSCSEKQPCVCYDFCSQGICKGTDDCVSNNTCSPSSVLSLRPQGLMDYHK